MNIIHYKAAFEKEIYCPASTIMSAVMGRIVSEGNVATILTAVLGVIIYGAVFLLIVKGFRG